MRLNEIIKQNKRCELWHQNIGHIVWEKKFGTWGLYFAKGIEAGDFLVADETVLFDDEWELKPASNRPSIDIVNSLINEKIVAVADYHRAIEVVDRFLGDT